MDASRDFGSADTHSCPNRVMVQYNFENGQRTYIRGTRTDADREYSKNWNVGPRVPLMGETCRPIQ